MGDFCVKYISDLPIFFVLIWNLSNGLHNGQQIWKKESKFPMYINNNWRNPPFFKLFKLDIIYRLDDIEIRK
jgi:hypothetical protein